MKVRESVIKKNKSVQNMFSKTSTITTNKAKTYRISSWVSQGWTGTSKLIYEINE